MLRNLKTPRGYLFGAIAQYRAQCREKRSKLGSQTSSLTDKELMASRPLPLFLNLSLEHITAMSMVSNLEACNDEAPIKP